MLPQQHQSKLRNTPMLRNSGTPGFVLEVHLTEEYVLSHRKIVKFVLRSTPTLQKFLIVGWAVPTK